MSDTAAATGMRVLGNPLPGDTAVISGESGAATFGFAMEILRKKQFEYLKKELNINEGSCLLFFSTEGDTDKENYRRIVWDGAYADTDH